MAENTKQATIIAVTSGKGGVGKTNIATNLAISLAKDGTKTCVFDADTGLANVNILLGLTPEFTIQHVLEGSRSLKDIILHYRDGVDIVPAASGIATLVDLDADQQQRLLTALLQAENSYDYIILDTAAGTGKNVVNFIQSAHYVILIITAEPTSLTDAFALLRVLKNQQAQLSPYVLVNMALNYADSMEVYKRFEAAVKKYLAVETHYLGYIIKDSNIPRAIKTQQPVSVTMPETLASRCFYTLAAVVKKQFSALRNKSFTEFWKNLLQEIGSSTEFSRQSGQHHITDRDIRKHDTAVNLKNQINEFAGNPEASAADIIDLLDIIYKMMASWFKSRDESTTPPDEEISQAMKEKLREITLLIEQHYNLPEAKSEVQGLIAIIRAMNARLAKRESALDRLLDLLQGEVDRINRPVGGKTGTLHRKTSN